jgi:hypothetical protein
VNRKRVASIEEMASTLKDLEKGDAVLLLIKRKSGYLYISLRVE